MATTSTKYHDEQADKYDGGYDAPYWKLYNGITWNYIKDCLPVNKNGLVLDAGGGTGLWAIKVAELGYKVVLTDVSAGMLDVARKKIEEKGLLDKITVVTSDIVEMKEFEDEKFDLVLAEGDPVSYCSDPERAIKELARVAKKGAFITVSVDNKLKWASQQIGRGNFEKGLEILNEGHCRMSSEGAETFMSHMFTIDDLNELFGKNNLTIIKAVGKPVFVKDVSCLDDPQIYEKFLEFECLYSSHPSVAGAGGHIAMIGQK